MCVLEILLLNALSLHNKNIKFYIRKTSFVNIYSSSSNFLINHIISMTTNSYFAIHRGRVVFTHLNMKRWIVTTQRTAVSGIMGLYTLEKF